MSVLPSSSFFFPDHLIDDAADPAVRAPQAARPGGAGAATGKKGERSEIILIPVLGEREIAIAE